jgi:hypothetical protein
VGLQDFLEGTVQGPCHTTVPSHQVVWEFFFFFFFVAHREAILLYESFFLAMNVLFDENKYGTFPITYNVPNLGASSCGQDPSSPWRRWIKLKILL